MAVIPANERIKISEFGVATTLDGFKFNGIDSANVNKNVPSQLIKDLIVLKAIEYSPTEYAEL